MTLFLVLYLLTVALAFVFFIATIYQFVFMILEDRKRVKPDNSMEECRPYKTEVAGSSPVRATKLRKDIKLWRCFQKMQKKQ